MSTASWISTLQRLDDQGLRRRLRTVPGDVVNLASNDYLGLARDPRVIASAADAAARRGVGSAASRLITGTAPEHEALEHDLAAIRGTEAALVFSSGYATNIGVLQALTSRHDLIVADALVHASLLDGARLSGARLVRHRHGDLEHLDERLRHHTGKGARFVVTEGIFSMEGDVIDLAGIAAIAGRHGATLIVDDAHGTGIAGSNGRGSVAAAGLTSADVPVQIGTLSKAIGTQGGYVAGDQALIDVLVQRARSFVYSTGLSPAIAAAARTSLSIAQEEDWRRERLRTHVATIRATLENAGTRPQVLGDPSAPMVLAVLGDAAAATDVAAALEGRGIIAPAIRPPTVPAGTSRIRLAPSAAHSHDDLSRACEVIGEVLAG